MIAKKKTPAKKTPAKKKTPEILAANFSLAKDGDDVALMVRDAEGNGVNISMSRVGADMLSDELAAHLNRPLEQGPAEWACTVADTWTEIAHNKKTRDDLIKVIPQRLIVALDLLQQSTRPNPLRKVLPK